MKFIVLVGCRHRLLRFPSEGRAYHVWPRVKKESLKLFLSRHSFASAEASRPEDVVVHTFIENDLPPVAGAISTRCC